MRPLSRRRAPVGGAFSAILAVVLAGCSGAALHTPDRPSPVASDSVERLTYGRAEVAVAARQGLGIVVIVRAQFTPTIVTLRPEDAALWSARAALWMDATRDSQPTPRVLRSEPTRSPGAGLFLERALVSGRPTLALYAIDSSGTHGSVLEFTEPELRDVLTVIWSASSERDSTLVAPETLGVDTVWTERSVTKLARPRSSKLFPRYPERMLREGVDGSVVLSFVIDTSGAVLMPSVEILESTRREFAPPVIDLMRRFSFEPAESGGRKVRVRYVVPFSFVVAKDTRSVKFDVLRIDERRPPLSYSSP